MPAESELRLTPDRMRQLGYRVVDLLVGHFAEPPRRPAERRPARSELEAKLREPIPIEGRPEQKVLEQVERDVLSSVMHPDHRRFFAFVPSPSNFVGVMADALAAGLNVFAGTWVESPGAAVVELVTLDWLRSACGLPETAEGLFVSGGSMANITALTAARHIRLGERFENAVVYCSDQTHSSIERGVRVIGFRRDQFRRLPSNDRFQISLQEVRSAVAEDRAAGRLPFCVVANAGTTNTGAIDPLEELATYCRDEDLWLHVDGAFGAAACLSERGRTLLAGLGQAHSVSLDPHKWLFQPFEIGCVLVRDSAWLTETFHILPEYMKDIEGSDEKVNFCDRGIQLTRSFRALKLWMSIKVFGQRAYGQAIERGLWLAETAQAVLQATPNWEVVTPAQMAIVTFRYAPPRLSAQQVDELNQQLVESAMADGFALLTSTRLRGRTVLRMCTINPRTTENDIKETVAWLDRLARNVR